ncbi:hypothetical protein M3Y14_34815 (plasmid) [Bacillus thuringiensis]|uniref:hypothetical protein n=1 Tax=Bacillus thuringiensis TaxID=1428 RepID=UPI002224C2FC|nr:hypothetical protein [Bacillus thuringiensis]UYX56156.1 hypothetical protein M3Y14_34815 [Bacillus thuringiensis]
MPDLWSGTMSLLSDSEKTWRGSSFKAVKDFNIAELYLMTEAPSSWDKAALWEVEESTGKIVSKIIEVIPSVRSYQAYANANGIEIKKGKVYLIVFRSSSANAKVYFKENADPITSELYQAMTSFGGTSNANYGSAKEPAIGESAIGNSYMIAVGFSIGNPKKYFEMGTSPITQWSNAKYTVSNAIGVKQDMKLVAIDFFTMNLGSELSEPGIARIWSVDGVLLAKGVPSVNQKEGAWTRSTFTSPVILEKDKAYYIGMTAKNIGCTDKLGGARNISSNDGSLLIGSGIQNYSASGDTDIRPTTPSSSYEFSLRLYVEIDNTRFLVDSDGTIKKLSGSWTDVGPVPVTEQMFKDHGMKSLDSITAEQWKALPKNSKILVYSGEDKVFKASISRNNLYHSEEKLYRGAGIIETETEELPAYRKTLVITADHQECTFQYSLDNGSTWNAFQSGDVIDVSAQSGKLFKIRINLPTDSASLTAISYAWA